MKIYFVRHGLIDYKTQLLSKDGQDFARKLHVLIPEEIEFIACDNEPRCKNTVLHFAAHKKINTTYYSKKQFENMEPLLEAQKIGTSVICYRIESINYLLRELDIPTFNQNNRDSAYEKIFVYEKNKEIVTTTVINTGYKKAI